VPDGMGIDRGNARPSRCLLRATCLTAALAMLSGTAIAADLLRLPVKAPPATASSADWTQFYAGFGIGFDVETGHTVATATGLGSANIDGFQGADLGLTATLGFDYQLSRLIVVGGFVDYDWSREKTTLTAAVPGFSTTLTMPTLHDAWTVGGRAGVLVAPDVLVYGLAGYTGVQLDNWSIGSTFGPLLQEPGLHAHGLTLGGGVEYRLADNWSLRGEYRHVSLNSVTNVDAGGGLVFTTSMSEHIARLVAAYRFGVPGVTGVTAAAPTPMRNWTGFYGGLGIGGDAITPHIDTVVGGTGFALDGLGGADFAGTVMVGYDRQVLPRWVVGAFGLFDLGSNGERKFTAGSGGGAISIGIPAVERSWTVGGRAGYLVAPDTLVYALAGYSGITFHALSYNLAVLAGTAQSPEFHGATVGAGFEKMFTDRVSARLEYRRTQLDTLPVVAPGFDSASGSAGVHAVRLIMTFRFPGQ